MVATRVHVLGNRLLDLKRLLAKIVFRHSAAADVGFGTPHVLFVVQLVREQLLGSEELLVGLELLDLLNLFKVT